jgi:NADH-quinone oxidoreductase subunit C
VLTLQKANNTKIIDELKKKFGEKIATPELVRQHRILVTTKKENVIEIAQFFKERYDLNYVISVSGVDYPEENRFVVVYHVSSMSEDGHLPLVLILKIPVDRQTPHIPSLIPIWKSAEWHERETWELFGIEFEGHPKLERLLLYDEWPENQYPLRKDFLLEE